MTSLLMAHNKTREYVKFTDNYCLVKFHTLWYNTSSDDIQKIPSIYASTYQKNIKF